MKEFIGTSGWWYKWWITRFYPQELYHYEWLKYYSRHFNIVEVNTTFYNRLDIKKVKSWIKRTPDDFGFVLKVPKTFSHMNQLEAIDNLRNGIKLLKDCHKYRGCLLQYPPNFEYNFETLVWQTQILSNINAEPIFIEPRHESFCLAENLANDLMGDIHWVTAYWHDNRAKIEPLDSVVYLRFHGTEKFAKGLYEEELLSQIIKPIYNTSNTIYAFFNNDFHGQAPQDAKNLIKVLENIKMEDICLTSR